MQCVHSVQRPELNVSSLSLFFLAPSPLTEPGTHQFSKADWLTSSRNPPVSAPKGCDHRHARLSQLAMISHLRSVIQPQI